MNPHAQKAAEEIKKLIHAVLNEDEIWYSEDDELACLQIISRAIEEATAELKAENARLREALEPFAEAHKNECPDSYHNPASVEKHTVGDLRKARAALGDENIQLKKALDQPRGYRSPYPDSLE